MRRWQRLVMAGTVTAAGVLAALPASLGAPPVPRAPLPEVNKTAAATVATTAATAPAPLVAPISRIKLRLDETEAGLAELLAAPPPGVQREARATAAQVSYRMIIRHLYEVALTGKGDDVRALAALKADTLVHGVAAFDALVGNAPQWQTLADAPADGAGAAKAKERAQGALAALAAFEKAARNANDGIETTEDLRSYLGHMLDALQPLVAVELPDEKPPVVWPTRPVKAGPAPVNPDELPPIDATIARVQRSNIMPSLRNELQAILPQLRRGWRRRRPRRPRRSTTA